MKDLNVHKLVNKLQGLFNQTLNLFLSELMLGAFLDSSLLFSISMLLATIYRFTSAFTYHDGTRADNTFFYSRINVVTISIFSAFLPLILQFPLRKNQRKAARAVLWFLAILLVITVTTNGAGTLSFPKTLPMRIIQLLISITSSTRAFGRPSTT
jgi:cytochrome bd-type quinol oxidase subunit 2